MNKELTLEQAKDIKARLDLAWKQVHEFTKQLYGAKFQVKFYPEFQCMYAAPDITVEVTKTETITL